MLKMMWEVGRGLEGYSGPQKDLKELRNILISRNCENGRESSVSVLILVF